MPAEIDRMKALAGLLGDESDDDDLDGGMLFGSIEDRRNVFERKERDSAARGSERTSAPSSVSRVATEPRSSKAAGQFASPPVARKKRRPASLGQARLQPIRTCDDDDRPIQITRSFCCAAREENRERAECEQEPKEEQGQSDQHEEEPEEDDGGEIVFGRPRTFGAAGGRDDTEYMPNVKERASALSHWKLTKKDKNGHARAMEWRVEKSEFSGGIGFSSHAEGGDDGDGTSPQDDGFGSVKKAKNKAPPSFLAHFEQREEEEEPGQPERIAKTSDGGPAASRKSNDVYVNSRLSPRGNKARTNRKGTHSFLSYFDDKDVEKKPVAAAASAYSPRNGAGMASPRWFAGGVMSPRDRRVVPSSPNDNGKNAAAVPSSPRRAPSPRNGVARASPGHAGFVRASPGRRKSLAARGSRGHRKSLAALFATFPPSPRRALSPRNAAAPPSPRRALSPVNAAASSPVWHRESPAALFGNQSDVLLSPSKIKLKNKMMGTPKSVKIRSVPSTPSRVPMSPRVGGGGGLGLPPKSPAAKKTPRSKILARASPFFSEEDAVTSSSGLPESKPPTTLRKITPLGDKPTQRAQSADPDETINETKSAAAGEQGREDEVAAASRDEAPKAKSADPISDGAEGGEAEEETITPRTRTRNRFLQKNAAAAAAAPCDRTQEKEIVPRITPRTRTKNRFSQKDDDVEAEAVVTGTADNSRAHPSKGGAFGRGEAKYEVAAPSAVNISRARQSKGDATASGEAEVNAAVQIGGGKVDALPPTHETERDDAVASGAAQVLKDLELQRGASAGGQGVARPGVGDGGKVVAALKTKRDMYLAALNRQAIKEKYGVEVNKVVALSDMPIWDEHLQPEEAKMSGQGDAGGLGRGDGPDEADETPETDAGEGVYGARVRGGGNKVVALSDMPIRDGHLQLKEAKTTARGAVDRRIQGPMAGRSGPGRNGGAGVTTSSLFAKKKKQDARLEVAKQTKMEAEGSDAVEYTGREETGSKSAEEKEVLPPVQKGTEGIEVATDETATEPAGAGRPDRPGGESSLEGQEELPLSVHRPRSVDAPETNENVGANEKKGTEPVRPTDRGATSMRERARHPSPDTRTPDGGGNSENLDEEEEEHVPFVGEVRGFSQTPRGDGRRTENLAEEGDEEEEHEPFVGDVVGVVSHTPRGDGRRTENLAEEGDEEEEHVPFIDDVVGVVSQTPRGDGRRTDAVEKEEATPRQLPSASSSPTGRVVEEAMNFLRTPLGRHIKVDSVKFLAAPFSSNILVGNYDDSARDRGRHGGEYGPPPAGEDADREEEGFEEGDVDELEMAERLTRELNRFLVDHDGDCVRINIEYEDGVPCGVKGIAGGEDSTAVSDVASTNGNDDREIEQYESRAEGMAMGERGERTGFDTTDIFEDGNQGGKEEDSNDDVDAFSIDDAHSQFEYGEEDSEEDESKHIDGRVDDGRVEHFRETNEHAYYKDETEASAVATDGDFFSFPVKFDGGESFRDFRELLMAAEAVASGGEAREEEEEEEGSAAFFSSSSYGRERSPGAHAPSSAKSRTPAKAKQKAAATSLDVVHSGKKRQPKIKVSIDGAPAFRRPSEATTAAASEEVFFVNQPSPVCGVGARLFGGRDSSAHPTSPSEGSTGTTASRRINFMGLLKSRQQQQDKDVGLSRRLERNDDFDDRRGSVSMGQFFVAAPVTSGMDSYSQLGVRTPPKKETSPPPGARGRGVPSLSSSPLVGAASRAIGREAGGFDVAVDGEGVGGGARRSRKLLRRIPALVGGSRMRRAWNVGGNANNFGSLNDDDDDGAFCG